MTLLTTEELLDIDCGPEMKQVHREICGKWAGEPHEQRDCGGEYHANVFSIGLRRAVAKAQLQAAQEHINALERAVAHPRETDATESRRSQLVEPRAAMLWEAACVEQTAKGMDTYGTPLKTFNGRNRFRDARSELVDAHRYLTQAEMEYEYMEAHIAALEQVLLDLVDASMCDADWRGWCAVHGWFKDGPCPHGRGRELLCYQKRVS